MTLSRWSRTDEATASMAAGQPLLSALGQPPLSSRLASCGSTHLLRSGSTLRVKAVLVVRFHLLDYAFMMMLRSARRIEMVIEPLKDDPLPWCRACTRVESWMHRPPACQGPYGEALAWCASICGPDDKSFADFASGPCTSG
ncbi:Hypothetical protein CINCED_3A000083 [Cinara cedri]|uniref:Uncharacterized protein n=1 Tax=Cinara cedri TaxID=506608 RepID=A0A5E4MPL5_9HEMI|nr:Hypothetical protein CINCED_3A000083 [Cinara cedri]